MSRANVEHTRAVRGHLTHVQEQRFRIATTHGPSLLLTLSHNTHADHAALEQLLRERADVVVEYTGEPGLASGIAHAVRRV